MKIIVNIFQQLPRINGITLDIVGYCSADSSIVMLLKGFNVFNIIPFFRSEVKRTII